MTGERPGHTTRGLIEVDTEACVGSATCVGIASDVFSIGAGGKAVVNPRGHLDEGVQDVQGVQDAIDGCPVTAIRWRSADPSGAAR
jgi:ferredoxin